MNPAKHQAATDDISLRGFRKNQLADIDQALARMPQLSDDMGLQVPAIQDRFDLDLKELTLKIEHIGGGQSTLVCAGRYFSQNTIYVFTMTYVHSGGRCEIGLPAVWGETEDVAGLVLGCRYVRGMVHDLLIQSHEPIPLAHFVPNYTSEVPEDEDRGLSDLTGRILLYTPQPAEANILSHLLKNTRVDLIVEADLGGVLDVLKQKQFDLLLCDTVTDPALAEKNLRRIRDTGYSRELIPLVSRRQQFDSHTLQQLNVTQTVTKPLDIEQLTAFLRGVLGGGEIEDGGAQSVSSRFADDEEMTELLIWYRNHIKVVLHELEQRILGQDVQAVASCCRTLSDTGSSYGYDALSEQADQTICEINASMSVEESSESLKDLVKLGYALQ
jgi:DNA-binding response OmpR family regulator